MTPSKIWLPYCGAAPRPEELLGRWNVDPVVIALLLAAMVGYAALAGATARERRYFHLALGLLVLLFVSPLCALSSALFSARVAHHVILTSVVAPLLVLALGRRLRLAGGLWFWTGMQGLVFWAWHAPPAYAWALSSDSAYWLMQASLLAGGVGFWVAIRRAAAPAAVAGLGVTMVHMGLLGALITFAPRLLYVPHLVGPQYWGFTPLEDQQLAGLIMWVPAAALYLLPALLLLYRMLGSAARPTGAA